MTRVCEYVERHLADPLPVARLARLVRMSPYHFIRTFRAETGVTPHRYVRTRRIERAKHLLETTPLSVTEICETVGFQSLGSFSSVFHRLTGETPLAFRAARRKPAFIPGCFIRLYRLGR